ncbi:MAG TPA: hydroxymethylbilane synthase [Candidatus Acidoferrales bacterium]|nr:hydroxymethylbilane synthase [Candidatus Acidoferrales bacterium]
MPLRIATRGSALALWQAGRVRGRLLGELGLGADIVLVKTSGDRFNQASVGALGLKGVFIKELEEALVESRAELAVHSMKDVPTAIDSRFAFPAVLRRDDVRDCLLSRSGAAFDQLPPGARVGTSSLRRRALLRHRRPDLEVADLRGNVDTRLAKLDRGDYDAIVVAKAGLDRLGLAERITQVLPCELVLPAVGQGALGIETRAADSDLNRLLAELEDPETRAAIDAERALLAELEGGCQVPVGAWARRENGRLVMDACVASVDPGASEGEFIRLSADASTGEEPEKLGRVLARRLLDAGADRILRLTGRNR